MPGTRPCWMAEASATMAQTRVAVMLQRIGTKDLLALAQGEVPPDVRDRHAADSLPPPFVAVRALALQRAAAAAASGDGGGGSLAGAIFFMQVGERVVGSCGFKDAAEDGWVEIGYGVAPGWQRQGVATQGVAALCELAFAGGSVQYVRACIEPHNDASAALARRLGFVAGSPVIEEDGTCVVVWTLAAPALPTPGERCLLQGPCAAD